MFDLSINLSTFTTFDYFIFSINLLLLIFSRPIITGFRKSKDETVFKTKLWALRAINIILFLLYVSALFFSHTKQISLTGLTFLLTFLAVHFIEMFIVFKFGREKEIDGIKYRTETYQSEIFGLLTVIIAVITSIIIVINIWELTDWLKATSVLGILAIIIFSTKDVWAPDNINGLILLYNGDIEPGAVIKVDDYDLLGIVIQTTLTQTSFRDLKSKHLMVIPNSKLRNCKVEVLSTCPTSGLMQTAELNISYGITSQQVDSFTEQVWQRACEANSAINPDKQAVARLLNAADHAVTWQLCYWVKNIYQLHEAAFSIYRAAYEVSLEQGIELRTPLTHEVTIHQD